MQDEEYYGRGTCHWALTGVGAMLRATNGETGTRLLADFKKERMNAGSPLTLYYPKLTYPRAELAANYPASGKEDPSAFFFQAEDGIRDLIVTGVQTCALPI